VIATAPSNWHIAGTGDFNGDGKSDILWQDTAGDVAIWEMNGANILANPLVATVASNWSIVPPNTGGSAAPSAAATGFGFADVSATPTAAAATTASPTPPGGGSPLVLTAGSLVPTGDPTTPHLTPLG